MTASHFCSSVTWIAVEESLPDDETLVLLAHDDTEVWPGWRDGEVWRHLDAMPITTERITHWTHLPAAPAHGE
ncbi:DUF551 domain-containing protein [Massilia sp.]|uniref:DUF551 domain-containing protein n=1 Tax=Massilia sp. TaxID=1882437 RepID=UPI00289BD25E|nr:DUF551 domain-containing protein [Massilia sp.]